DHIRGCYQPAHDLLPLTLHRIERDALLVAVDLQKQRAFTAAADRRHKAILAAIALFHANDLGAKLGQQCRAIGTCDIAPEIEDAHALKNSPHRSLPQCFRQTTGIGFRGKVATDARLGRRLPPSMGARSRDTFCPGFAISLSLWDQTEISARRESRTATAPAVPCAKVR